MNPKQRMSIGVIVATCLVIFGCSFAPSLEFFATPTPTSTLTLTPTSTPTLTPTNTPVPPTPTPMVYILPAGTFPLDTQNSCTTDATISNVDGNTFRLTDESKITLIFNPSGGLTFALWCPGAKHTWLGTLSYRGYTFASSDSDPLQFIVRSGGGYEYIGGTGTVTQPDGNRVDLANGGASGSAGTGPAEEENWAVDFDYVFPVPFWSVGTHEYVLISDCPSFPELTGTFTFSFEVSASAKLYPDPVHFRLSGLIETTTGSYSHLDTINPGQATISEWTVRKATRSVVDQAIAECKVTISWDGGNPQPLVPQDPYQQ